MVKAHVFIKNKTWLFLQATVQITGGLNVLSAEELKIKFGFQTLKKRFSFREMKNIKRISLTFFITKKI